jgi:N-acetyl-gamma-glutamyl-phosphate reductase
MRVAVIGATGYAGVELVRLLSKHAHVSLTCVTSDSYISQWIQDVYPHFRGIVDLKLREAIVEEVAAQADLVFIALPAGLSGRIVPAFLAMDRKVVDLGGDFRIPAELYWTWYKKNPANPEIQTKAVYGLPEYYRTAIRETNFVTNPGCYPTAVLLGLLPLVKEGLIDLSSLVIDAKSGVTGAGRGLSLGTHFCEVNENFKVYKVGQHQHTPEIEQELGRAAGSPVTVTFTTHLLPLNRGILVTSYARLREEFRSLTTADLITRYHSVYASCPFVRIRPEGEFPQVKEVAASNYCDIGIHVEPRTSRVIVVSVIDNLVKGAAGQAVQNMNIMCGFAETEGLLQTPVYP